MPNKIATIILNRNLPEQTNALYEHIYKYDKNITDVYIVEAGSDRNKLSKYYTWYVADDFTKINGLRFNRGMNFGIHSLIKENKYQNYDAFFLITNDTLLNKKKTLSLLFDCLKNHERLGIISPCSKTFGEINLFNSKNIIFTWYLHSTALLIKKGLIDKIGHFEKENYFNFLFDGDNFRGCFSEMELILKSYSNEYSVGITNKVFAEENESWLMKLSHLIKTDSYESNLDKYLTEGYSWIHKKFGYTTHWQLYNQIKLSYDQYFDWYPEDKIYTF